MGSPDAFPWLADRGGDQLNPVEAAQKYDVVQRVLIGIQVAVLDRLPHFVVGK